MNGTLLRFTASTPTFRAIRAIGLAWVASAMVVGATAHRANGITLADLAAGATFNAGSARFSNWQITSLDDTAAPLPDLTLITVSPLIADPAQPGFQLVANSQLEVTGINAIDIVLSYRVQAFTGASSFTGQSLAVASGSPPNAGGIASVSQDNGTPTSQILGSTLTLVDNETPVQIPNAAMTFASRWTVDASMNIFLTGNSTGDSINLTTITVRFTQNGLVNLAGDFNNDKSVDGADLLRWQRGQSPIPNSTSDLSAWRNNFGQSTVAVAAISAIPEPSAAVLMLVALVATFRRRRE